MTNYLVRNTETGAFYPVVNVQLEMDAYTAVVEAFDIPQSVADAPLEIMNQAWVCPGEYATKSIRSAKEELWQAMGPDATEAERDAVWEADVVHDPDADAYYVVDLVKAIERVTDNKSENRK